LPCQEASAVPCQFFNKQETEIIDAEILKLLDQKVFVKANFEEGQFISPIFLCQKKNGEYRLILNLKKLNDSMPYEPGSENIALNSFLYIANKTILM